jgi:hypothetical protein
MPLTMSHLTPRYTIKVFHSDEAATRYRVKRQVVGRSYLLKSGIQTTYRWDVRRRLTERSPSRRVEQVRPSPAVTDGACRG